MSTVEGELRTGWACLALREQRGLRWLIKLEDGDSQIRKGFVYTVLSGRVDFTPGTIHG